MKRVFLIVLDSCGIGQMPDAAAFGDRDCHTMRRISASPAYCADNLLKMGQGNIDGQDYLPSTDAPTAAVARLAETSMGKDTTIGHWEIAGVISPKPLPTYPDGFPPEVLEAFSAATGRGVLCNKPYSGTEVIADYGAEHVKTGDLIVYTSADSVFQIAAHEDVVPVQELYHICRTARRILKEEHCVGRVIARPFIGSAGNYVRTGNRRDFSVDPFGDTMLDVLKKNHLDVIGVGKIEDIFNHRGLTASDHASGNDACIDSMIKTLRKDNWKGLMFVNLVDTDALYGHRNDVDGFAECLEAFDSYIPENPKSVI